MKYGGVPSPLLGRERTLLVSRGEMVIHSLELTQIPKAEFFTA